MFTESSLIVYNLQYIYIYCILRIRLQGKSEAYILQYIYANAEAERKI